MGACWRVGNASQAPDIALGGLAHWLQDKTTAGFIVGRWVSDHPRQAQESLRWALDAVARGALRVEVSDERDWADAGSALTALQRGDTTGKIVLRIQ